MPIPLSPIYRSVNKLRQPVVPLRHFIDGEPPRVPFISSFFPCPFLSPSHLSAQGCDSLSQRILCQQKDEHWRKGRGHDTLPLSAFGIFYSIPAPSCPCHGPAEVEGETPLHSTI